MSHITVRALLYLAFGRWADGKYHLIACTRRPDAIKLWSEPDLITTADVGLRGGPIPTCPKCAMFYEAAVRKAASRG